MAHYELALMVLKEKKANMYILDLYDGMLLDF